MENKTEDLVETPSTSLPDYFSDENEIVTCTDMIALQKILPEEVWLIITGKVIKNQENVFQDFRSLSNSSPYFRILLESKRVLYLFEWVFLVAHRWILATSEDDKGNSSDSDSENDWETLEQLFNEHPVANTLPELPDQKPISAIKSCRQVCSIWNLSVDEMIFEQVIPPTRKGLHSLEKRILQKMEFERFENSIDVNKFQAFFKGTHPKADKGIKNRSPFISKEVEIDLYCDGDNIERDPGFPKAIETLLDTYGNHIWGFGVHVVGRNVYIENHTDYLKKGLSYVKRFTDLKRLTVVDNTSNFYGSLDEAIIEEGVERDEIEDNPEYQLPHFPKLVELTTSGLAVSIFEHLIQNNDHINILKVHRNPEGNYNISNLAFPNLHILHLNFWNMEQVDMLENLGFQWSLTQLKFSYCNGAEFADYSRIFNVIETNWWNTLTYLNIHLPEARNAEDYWQVLEDTGNGTLELPLLETLKLTIYQEFFLDFILPTRHTLKKLSITQVDNYSFFEIPILSKKEKMGETIKFASLDGGLRDSNIWEMFPNLVYTYTSGCKKDGDFVEEISRS